VVVPNPNRPQCEYVDPSMPYAGGVNPSDWF
jgi:hypothetical protein